MPPGGALARVHPSTYSVLASNFLCAFTRREGAPGTWLDPGWGRSGGSEERQKASSSANSGPAPGGEAYPGEEERQGEPGEDGETRSAVGVSGDIDPGTETSARYKQEDEAEEWG